MSPAKRSTITLTTIGRTSGHARAVTLYAFEHGGTLVIVGSNGGAARDPAWVGNLRAEPMARARAGRDERRVHAREIQPGAERVRLWEVVSEAFPLYASYQRRTRRLIPLFMLEPVHG